MRSETASHVWQDVRVLVVAVVVLLSVAAPQFAFRAGAIACVVIVALGAVAGRKFRVADWIGIAYVSLALVSLLWSEDLRHSIVSVANAGSCVAIFLAVRMAVNRARDYRLVGGGMILGALISLLRMGERAGGLRLSFEVSAERVAVDGINQNYSAYSFVSVAVIVLTLTVRQEGEQRVLPRSLGVALIFLMYAGVLLNGTRGAIVSLVLLAIWWSFSRVREGATFGLAVAAFIVGHAVILIGWLDAFLASTVSPSDRETGDLNGRLTLWPLARQSIGESPLIGNGAGAFRGLNPYGINAHSAILDVGSGLGVLGIILFFGTFWSALRGGPARSAVPRGYYVAGAFVVASLPVLLSGFWIESPVLWGTAALISRWEALGAMRDRALGEGSQ